MVISSSQGLQAYSRQSTIIADESRLLEVDTAGRVVWSTENTQLDFYTGSIVASKARYPITPNARVYRYGENELLIVEPERNRVAIIDRAGAEIRTITQFIPDRVPLRDTNGNMTRIIDLRTKCGQPRTTCLARTTSQARPPTCATRPMSRCGQSLCLPAATRTRTASNRWNTGSTTRLPTRATRGWWTSWTAMW
jgi:hypothetical protein